MTMYEYLDANMGVILALNIFWGIVVLLGKLVALWAEVLHRRDRQLTSVREDKERKDIRDHPENP